MSGDFHKIGNIKGANGVGVPEGGQRGQVLRKVGDTDFATGWGSVNYADVEGKVPRSALPDLGIAPMPVKSEAEMLNLPAVVGNMAIRTDLGKTFVLMEEPASTLGNWLELVTTSDVQSVNGQTGNVQLTKADVGLGNVDNTADSDKPEATASVRGLMPAADKAKLNNATSAATASRLAIRDSAGRISFKQVTLSDAPTSNAQAATKSYVDTEVGQRFGAMKTLAGEDLNSLTSEGFYGKVGSADIRNPALNYPEGSPGAGALEVTKYSATGTHQQWTSWGGGSAKDVRRWIRNSNDNGANWTAWRELAGTDYVNTEITAAKKHTDDRFGALAGGSVLSNTDWDAMRSTASTGVVEGWVKGCPIGGKLVGNMSAGFVIDPVWKLEVRPEGLNYVTQRATLLNCTPKFMVGFMWERIYNPAQAKWSAWTCVGGDSGPLTGQVGGLLENASVEAPFRSVQNSSVYLYNNSEPLTAQRIGGEVRFWGAMSSTKLDDMASTSTATNPTLAYFSDYDYRADPNKPGADYTLGPSSYRFQFPIQSGSYRNHWLMGPANKDGVKWAFVASRYGPNVASNPPWLPFNITWPVPAINTYTGPGFIPPILDAQSGTGPS